MATTPNTNNTNRAGQPNLLIFWGFLIIGVLVAIAFLLRFPNLSPDQMQAVIQRYIAWRARIQKDGRAMSGHKLHDGEGRVMRGAGGSILAWLVRQQGRRRDSDV